MPIYEYTCECGYEGECMRPMEDRYNAKCPECGSKTKLKVSLSTHRMAQPFTVVGGDGTVLSRKQTTEGSGMSPPGREV